MKNIQFNFRLKIHKGKVEEFKEIATKYISVVKEKDQGTLQYNWFFNEDQTECVVRENYGESDAVVAHMSNLVICWKNYSDQKKYHWKCTEIHQKNCIKQPQFCILNCTPLSGTVLESKSKFNN
jgi:quinol monooxygenase YgiN